MEIAYNPPRFLLFRTLHGRPIMINAASIVWVASFGDGFEKMTPHGVIRTADNSLHHVADSLEDIIEQVAGLLK